MRNRLLRYGFTLVELLVVITIILVLLAILLPTMGSAIDRAETASCQSNMRQLAIGYTGYAVDNSSAIMRGEPANQPDAFVYRGAGYDPIRNGALFKYVHQVELYRCPADPNGNERSYVIVGPLRGEGWTGGSQQGVDRLTAVVNTAKQILFVEESDKRGWNIGSWLIRCDDGGAYRWVDYVGLFHDGETADDFVFVDGHVERRQWVDENTLIAGRTETFHMYDPNNPDWDWVRPLYRNMQTVGNCRYIPGF